jgi:hypothetical protein
MPAGNGRRDGFFPTSFDGGTPAGIFSGSARANGRFAPDWYSYHETDRANIIGD